MNPLPSYLHICLRHKHRRPIIQQGYSLISLAEAFEQEIPACTGVVAWADVIAENKSDDVEAGHTRFTISR